MTKILNINDDVVLIRATVTGANGDVIATGHAEEYRDQGYINKTSAVENAETGAIGRALAACGFGGSDTEYASADEMIRALRKQTAITEGALSPVKHRKYHDGLMTAVEDDDGPALLAYWEELTQEQQGWIWFKFQSWERRSIKALMSAARNPEVDADISGAGT